MLLTMNKVVKAENEKIAAIDFATAAETNADGLKRAEIKMAEGIKQAKILEASFSEKKDLFVMDISSAYKVPGLKLERSFIYDTRRVVSRG